MVLVLVIPPSTNIRMACLSLAKTAKLVSQHNLRLSLKANVYIVPASILMGSGQSFDISCECTAFSRTI